MTRREELIVLMLRSWDLCDAATGNGQPGSGEHVPLQSHEPHCLIRKAAPARCSCWLRSMAELQRCLRLMRQQERRLWWNCHERHVAAVRRPMLVQVKRGRPVHDRNIELVGLVDKGALNKRGDGIVRVLVEQWSPRVDVKLASEGVSWLARTFVGEPQLPVELLRDAA